MHRQLTIRLFEANCRVIDQQWNAADVRSAFWRCYVNDHDGAELLLSGEEREHWPIPRRCVVLVPAWVGFSCRNHRTVKHRYVHFDVIGMPTPLVQDMFPRPRVLKTSQTMRREICLAIDETASDPGPVAMLRLQAVMLNTLALTLAEHPQRDRLSYWLTGESRIQPAVAYIENNLADDLTTAVLARRCGLSEGHFTRLFRQELGQTPARFVLDRRLAYAAQLLAFTDQTIEIIAESTGFADRFHFSHVFARRIGMPPARYRKGGNPQT